MLLAKDFPMFLSTVAAVAAGALYRRQHCGRQTQLNWNATCLQFGKLYFGGLRRLCKHGFAVYFGGTGECFACRTVPIRCIILHLICMPDDMDNILLLYKVTSNFEMLLNFYAYGMKNRQHQRIPLPYFCLWVDSGFIIEVDIKTTRRSQKIYGVFVFLILRP